MFNPESMLWRGISKAVDFVGLGLFWAALCLPLITIIPATAALYYTVVKTFRHGEEDAFRMMWTSFLSNLRKSWVVSLLCIPIVFLLACGYSVMLANTGTALGIVMYAAYCMVLTVPFSMLFYLSPLTARFELRVRDLFRTAFSLTICHLPTSLLAVVINLLLIQWTLVKWTPIFITPVSGVLLVSFLYERNFRKHLSEEELDVFDR